MSTPALHMAAVMYVLRTYVCTVGLGNLSLLASHAKFKHTLISIRITRCDEDADADDVVRLNRRGENGVSHLNHQSRQISYNRFRTVLLCPKTGTAIHGWGRGVEYYMWVRAHNCFFFVEKKILEKERREMAIAFATRCKAFGLLQYLIMAMCF
ncbi:hypothetical protein F4781DRAFT_124891 [Annulohypoxylon bovei var. microspora]|nr:hypothetical protein F4781DRAFT_124891 [Annulohypoxylon bovei var. microspora]